MDKAEIVFEKLAKFYRPLLVELPKEIIKTHFSAGGAVEAAAVSINKRDVKKYIKELSDMLGKNHVETAVQKNKGIIVVPKSSNTLKIGKNEINLPSLGESPIAKRFVLRHELTHSLRDDKGKLSNKFYKILPFNAVEESAANIAALKRDLPPGVRHAVGTILGTGQAMLQRPLQTLGIAAGGIVGGNYLNERKYAKQKRTSI